MSKKALGIITKEKFTLDIFSEQLADVFGHGLQLQGVFLEDSHIQASKLNADVILVSGHTTLHDALKKEIVPAGARIIVARRTLNIQKTAAILDLLRLPEGTKVAITDNTRQDNSETVEEIIVLLREMGIHHLHFVPYFPGHYRIPEQTNTALTFGLPQLVPPTIRQVIDLGWRQLDVGTITDIIQYVDYVDHPVNIDYFNHNRAVVSLAKELVESSLQTFSMNKKLQGVMNSSEEGILLLNAKREVVLTNQTALEFLGKGQDEIEGKKLEAVLGESEGTFELPVSSKLISVNQHNFMVTASPVDSTSDLGYVTVLRKVSAIQNMEIAVREQLYTRDYRAKYQLGDIITVNNELIELKKYAAQIAKSDFNIMIYGESGTGKELFAQAIHNESNRCNGPFVAANVAAFSDNLIESELFGYEEGAFTGAKKGGKPGLFELAHRGTIFLDEIGELSLPLQSKLLRVIQEREVRRVGSVKTIPIQTRIIAATNRNLHEMVKNGSFRIDLFYRLHVLPIHLPALRDRAEDIMSILQVFLNKHKLSTALFAPELTRFLSEYAWPGNIRELENFATYIACYAQIKGLQRIGLTDEISGYFQSQLLLFDSPPPVDDEDDLQKELETQGYLQDYLLVLAELKKAQEHDQAMSRQKLYAAIKGANKLSFTQLRDRMERLAKSGLIAAGKTKQGTKITERGLRFLANKSRY